jgi:thymidylate kinase
MLITFSGIVGSGKSRGARQVLELLTSWGYMPYYPRFRFLRWWHLLLSPVRQPWQKPQARSYAAPPYVAVNSQLPPRARSISKRLSLLRFLGYWLRIMRFRLVMAVHFRNRLVVLNRYFYDNLVHLNISTARERKYLGWLFAAIPKPDLAFLMVVHPQTAVQRRPAYDGEDLHQLTARYANLQKYQKDFAVIATDNVRLATLQLEQAVCTAFHRPSLSDVYDEADLLGSPVNDGENFDELNLRVGV